MSVTFSNPEAVKAFVRETLFWTIERTTWEHLGLEVSQNCFKGIDSVAAHAVNRSIHLSMYSAELETSPNEESSHPNLDKFVTHAQQQWDKA
jgi:hypothetical protein